MMSISRSTASLDSFRSESSVDKLSRLSKSYSLTNLSKRKRSSSSERTFDKDTLSSRNKLKVNRKRGSESPRDRTLTRLSKNIERDRNSEQVLSRAYRERCKGVMNQTTSRTESKKRDSAVLSGSAGRTRLPPISKPTAKQPAPTTRARSGKPEIINSAPRARSGTRSEEPTRRARAAREEEMRKKSGRPEDNSRGRKNFVGVVNKANPARSPARSLVGAANRGAANKPGDDVKLNKKYAGVVCETCKLQIHEKLKRGYTKYRSLEKMKTCEKCQKSVIDFDFYQICIDCAKDLQVCAKCASGSTMISGERFVEVVRQGVTENILSMNDRELSQFAKKHAKIGIVEQKIGTLEDNPSDKSGVSTRTPSARSSAKSRRASSAKSSKSSKQSPAPRQIDAELKVEKPPKVSTTDSKKVSKNARSITSSSSPLVGSETETCLSSTESDEAYGSGHISSVSDVKTVRSATKSNRSRHKSSEILRQIRSLTTLQITSPTSAQSVIREIRSLTEMDYYDDDEKSEEGGRKTPTERKTPRKAGSAKQRGAPSPQPSYTPFSGTSDRSNLQEDQELREYMNSRTPNLPPITITGTVTQDSHSHPQLEPSQVMADPPVEVREYSPSPPVVTITTVTKQVAEDESSTDSSDESEIEDDSNLNGDKEVVLQEVTSTDTEVEDEAMDDETKTVTDETESIAEIVEHVSPESDVVETGATEPVSEVTGSHSTGDEVLSIYGSDGGSNTAADYEENLDDVTETSVSSEVAEETFSGTPTDQDTSGETIITNGEEKSQCDGEVDVGVGMETHVPAKDETLETMMNVSAEANVDVLGEESQLQKTGEFEIEGFAEDTVLTRKENCDTNRNHDLVTIEDVVEEEVYDEQLSPIEKESSFTVPGGQLLDTIDSTTDYFAPRNEEVAEIVEIGESARDGTDAVQSRQVDDVRVEDVDEDHFVRIPAPKQLRTGESDDSSDTTDEARLSSELETFLGDTPKSNSSNDSPQNHQARSQDPSSTEVQVSSSASDRDRQNDANGEECTPRSRKPVFERQISEERAPESVLETVGENFEDFRHFYENHAFDIVEIHKNSPEELLYDEEEEHQDYYEECYQYQYNARLRIRLEDIPEEGTLSKESTYLSHPFTDTLDKEDTATDREGTMLEGGDSVLDKEDSNLEMGDYVVEKEQSTVDKDGSTLGDMDRETSVEIVVNDIVNCALIKASLSLMDEKTPRTVGRSS